MSGTGPFDQDEPVTIVATARAAGSGDGIWDGHPSPVIALQLTLSGRVMLLPLGSPDVTVIRGDIRGVLARMARDALEFRKLLDGMRVRTGCRDETGHPCPECVVDVEHQRQYREVLDALERRPALSIT